MMKGYRLIGIYLLIVLTALILLCSCKTQYVPVEIVRTELQHKTDTINKTDTVIHEKNTIIREADSTLIKELGLKLNANERAILILRKELERIVSKESRHITDTVVKTDSIHVPYPVPAQLSKWQSFCCDYGKVMIGVSIILLFLLIVLLYKVFKYKSSS